jgi:hypothetical protein
MTDIWPIKHSEKSSKRSIYYRKSVKSENLFKSDICLRKMSVYQIFIETTVLINTFTF